MSHPEPILAPRPAVWSTARELVALTKPRITLMVVLTAAAGMWLAETAVAPVKVVVALSAIALVVAGANALNCWLERDVDRLMVRTARRPLPAKRLEPTPALLFGLVLGAISVPLLFTLVNPLTALLGAGSLVLYVCVYTPMKQITPAALLVGAIPGAMPPLMGFTAATGRIELPGLALFLLLFLWQLPHFIAISVVRRRDYERAGLKVLPAVRGDRVARLHAAFWGVLIVPVAVLPFAVGSSGIGYLVVATALSLLYAGSTVAWLFAPEGDIRAARRVFLVSIAYIPIVLAALMVDGLF